MQNFLYNGANLNTLVYNFDDYKHVQVQLLEDSHQTLLIISFIRVNLVHLIAQIRVRVTLQKNLNDGHDRFVFVKPQPDDAILECSPLLKVHAQ